jgi:hypothetical protein
MKLVRMNEMCLNEANSEVHIGKHLYDTFPVQYGLKQEMLHHHCFSTLLYNMPLGRSKKSGGTEIKWDTSAAGLC